MDMQKEKLCDLCVLCGRIEWMPERLLICSIIGDDPAQGRQADIGDGVDFSCHEERSTPCISRSYRNNSG